MTLVDILSIPVILVVLAFLFLFVNRAIGFEKEEGPKRFAREEKLDFKQYDTGLTTWIRQCRIPLWQGEEAMNVARLRDGSAIAIFDLSYWNILTKSRHYRSGGLIELSSQSPMFYLCRKSVFNRWRKPALAIESGDIEFDKRYWIETETIDSTRTFLSTKIRQTLLKHNPKYVESFDSHLIIILGYAHDDERRREYINIARNIRNALKDDKAI